MEAKVEGRSRSGKSKVNCGSLHYAASPLRSGWRRRLTTPSC